MNGICKGNCSFSPSTYSIGVIRGNLRLMPNSSNNRMHWNFPDDLLPHIRTWLYPKDVELASRFVEGKTESLSRLVIYGAGTHTLELLRHFSPETRRKIVGILDRSPEAKEFPVPVCKPDEFRKLNVPFDKIILSHFERENSMLQVLLDLGFSRESILTIYENEDFARFLEEEDRFGLDLPIPEKRKERIAFVSVKNGIEILSDRGKQLLREMGEFETFHLNMSRDFRGTNGIYDFEFNCRRSLCLLFGLLEQIKPDIVYIHDQMETRYFLPRLVKGSFPEAKVIWEPYDTMRLWLEDYRLLSDRMGWSQEEVRFFRNNEDYNLEFADGIVYKEVGEKAHRLFHEERKGKSLHFHNYLSAQEGHFENTELLPPYRLVYAGSIVPTSSNDPFGADNHLIEPFQLILGSGVGIDVYLNASRENIQAMYSDYLALEGRYPNFSIQPRVGKGQLIETISKKYHFGIHIVRNNDDIYSMSKERFAATFSAKLWSYIFAGLPIIVSSELTGMADFVNNHRIGVSVHSPELQGIAKLLDSIKPDEYKAMKQNVLQLAKLSCIENKGKEILNFLQEP